MRRYSLILSGGTFSGYIAVQIPDNVTKFYNDEAIRRMFASAVVRREVPVPEQLALLPFDLSELSDFKNIRTLGAGAAIVLADSDETTGLERAPFMVIGLMSSAPSTPDDRGRFAQQTATTIPGIRDARLTMSEPVRIGGTPGYETRIDATSGKENTPVTVVQWLRYGGSNTLRIIASAPRDQWQTALTRFRAVRDGNSAALSPPRTQPAENSTLRRGAIFFTLSRRPDLLTPRYWLWSLGRDATCWTEGGWLRDWVRRRSPPRFQNHFGRRLRSSSMTRRRFW